MEQTLYDLLLQDVRFLLGAELEQETSLRELVDVVQDSDLQQVMNEHAAETTKQIQRLQAILQEAGEETEGEVPSAVGGLIDDAEMIVDLELAKEIRDVALAAAARKMEHYEISCYESAISIAEELGLEDLAQPLRQTLEEERRADQRLADVASTLIRTQIPRETEQSRS